MPKPESNHFKSKVVVNGSLIKFDEQSKISLSQMLYKT